MKTIVSTWMIGGLCFLATTPAFRASADQPAPAAKPGKAYTGIVVAVDNQEHVLKVKGWLLSKSFNLGEKCTYTFLGNRSGTAGDLHPGQKVSVGYRNATGVLVADRVEQQPMRFEGRVKAIDPAKNALTVHVRGMDRAFQLPRDCIVELRDDKSGTLADVQPGHHVTVTYEIANGITVAREIAQTSASFTGALTAVDLTDRTVKAKGTFGSKKFHLADGCVIVRNGRTDAELRELKLGDKLTFSYDDVDGVNVANRIANTTGNSEP